MYAILLEGRIVGSSERGGNENPVEGREGGVAKPLELATPWLTDADGRRRIGGSVGRVERCRRSAAGRLHWGL